MRGIHSCTEAHRMGSWSMSKSQLDLLIISFATKFSLEVAFILIESTWKDIAM